jgi:proteasome alpha subunit
LIERAQLKAQQHTITYDSPIDTLTIVKDICDLKQVCTQSGGLRPFGVSVLVAGIDDHTPRLYETDPTGIFFQYKATVIGEGEIEIEEILHKEYKPELTIEEGFKLSLKALKKVLGDNFKIERIDAAYITIKEKKFKKFSKEKIEKTAADIKDIKKKK